MEIDVAEWADKWQKATDEYDGPMRGRRAVQVQFILDLCRAVIAADKAKQPATAPAGDVPESKKVDPFKAHNANVLRDAIKKAFRTWNTTPGLHYMEAFMSELLPLFNDCDSESEIARRVAEATAARDAEIERLKAELAEAKTRALPAGWEMSETMISRQDECERLAKENATLREQLAEATTPVDLDSANIRELDGMKMIYLGDAQAAVRCERAARLAAERRLALTREAWRHRSISAPGFGNGTRFANLTDADIDAAIAAHKKSKADAAGGDNDE